MGTPAFMAPEQVLGEPLDPRADVYVMGATFYALLTAAAPCARQRTREILEAHCQEPPPDPRAIRPEIPAAAVAVIAKAMAKRPADRYAGASEMMAALEGLLSRPETAVRERDPGGAGQWAAFLAATGSATTIGGSATPAAAQAGTPRPGAEPGAAVIAGGPATARTRAVGRTTAQLGGRRGPARPGGSGPIAPTPVLLAVPAVLGLAAAVAFGLWLAGRLGSPRAHEGATVAASTNSVPAAGTGTGTGTGTGADGKPPAPTGDIAELLPHAPPEIREAAGAGDPVLDEFARLVTEASRRALADDDGALRGAIAALRAFADRHAGSAVKVHRDAAEQARREAAGHARGLDPFEAPVREPTRTLDRSEERGPLKCVAFRPDGGAIAVGDSAGWVEVSAPDGSGRVEFRAHKGVSAAVRWSPDGARLATAGHDGTVTVRDGRSPSAEGAVTLKGHAKAALSLAFLDGGSTLLAGGEDATIRGWELPSGRELPVATGHGDCVNALAASADGRRLFSASCDSSVHAWFRGDAGAGGASSPFGKARIVGEHDSLANAAVLSPDGRTLVTAGGDGFVRIWSAPAGPDGKAEDLAALKASLGRLWAVALGPGKAGLWLAAGGDDKVIRLWSLPATAADGGAAAPKPVARLRGHTGPIRGLAFSPDGRVLVSVADDATVRFWELPLMGP
jgi:hypothetical protein